MLRYKMTAFYEDKTNATRVAQSVVVIGPDVQAAVNAVKETLAPRAQGGHIVAVEVKEQHKIETGVVFVGEPYIPLHWPLTNRKRRAAVHDAPHAAAEPPAEPVEELPTEEFATASPPPDEESYDSI
ncbi:MAG TPA: hypothetical protein PLE19_02760 [Planctomycetota bacterium]|nr:hypothetical protein [Planctomycetota bacterium]HRR79973.1 hypothetical protein [Planctomycetota bacterium]HRT95281.1 hypothetical protein [Planctomycetota bacterium]